MPHVILVHGWDGQTNWGPLEWSTFTPLLLAAGYEVHTPSLGSDNVANAGVIANLMGALPPEAVVHFVCHSMGGLSARRMLKDITDPRIVSYIALDTPQYGVSWFKALLFGNVSQLWSGCQFLADLNAPDATPGELTYVQLICDYTQLLPGIWWKALTGVTHKNMVTDTPTLELVLRILQGDLSDLAVN